MDKPPRQKDIVTPPCRMQQIDGKYIGVAAFLAHNDIEGTAIIVGNDMHTLRLLWEKVMPGVPLREDATRTVSIGPAKIDAELTKP